PASSSPPAVTDAGTCSMGPAAVVDEERILPTSGLPPKNWSTSNGSPSVDCVQEGLMRKRRKADEVARLLREADRDLARGLIVGDVCRKLGIAQMTYHRWRHRHDPARVDTDGRRRELEVEVERLKLLVAELMLDKQ